ncbi:hypothetical protein PR202_gb08638 [Eleusine coracana subsp. coracana]|uniref:Uncharacterized protein n=1 Tax=Eleusine coracana subsp. coracana TaxID=191504 RepID=A0AAV5EEC6_ELECO|nr:hypothetical protein PR202_gb08638 [Eleusine coracana subsp. coracana]
MRTRAASVLPPSTPPAPFGTSSARLSTRSSLPMTRRSMTSPGAVLGSLRLSLLMALSACLTSGTRSTPQSSMSLVQLPHHWSGWDGTSRTQGTWPLSSWTAPRSLCLTSATQRFLW